MNQTGVESVGSRRQARRKVSFTRPMVLLRVAAPVPAARGASPTAFDRPCGITTWGCAPNPRRPLAGTPAPRAASAEVHCVRLGRRLLECSSSPFLNYIATQSHIVEYAPSSRLVRRAPDRSRCDVGMHHGLLGWPARKMPYLRFSRDKRGYENTYVLHTFRGNRGPEPRLLYWFRTPPGARVGRHPLDEEAIRALEASNPGLDFDWSEMLKVRMPPRPPETRAASSKRPARRRGMRRAPPGARRQPQPRRRWRRPRRRSRSPRRRPRTYRPRKRSWRRTCRPGRDPGRGRGGRRRGRTLGAPRGGADGGGDAGAAPGRATRRSRCASPRWR